MQKLQVILQVETKYENHFHLRFCRHEICYFSLNHRSIARPPIVQSRDYDLRKLQLLRLIIILKNTNLNLVENKDDFNTVPKCSQEIIQYIVAMYFRDIETASSTSTTMDGARRSMPRTNLGWFTENAPVIFEHSELRTTCHRPFHTPPSTPNRHTRTYQKWFWGTCCLIGVTLGYFLGLHSPEPTVRQSVRTAESTASKATLQQSVQTAISAFSKPTLKQSVLTLATVVSKPIFQQSVLAVAPAARNTSLSEVEFVSLHGGDYLMGDNLDGLKDALPHHVRLAPYKIAKYEVTRELWDSVMLWGRDHGYQDLPSANGKAQNHPVYGISWGDAVKWCNALSEKEGLTPCYYLETTLKTVVRKGMADICNQQVNWQADGYRLPTEAEWEFAARGGQANKRFPNGDEITQEHANYHGSTDIAYDQSRRTGTAANLMSSMPYSAAVGSFPPNKYGLYDMAGNMAEWCWDFYDRNYTPSVQPLHNPHGPQKGKNCVVRGGSWRHSAADARCASRLSLPGDLPVPYVGFRLVRGP